MKVLLKQRTVLLMALLLVSLIPFDSSGTGSCWATGETPSGDDLSRKAYSEGYRDGYRDAFREGYREGHQDGYKLGYAEGKAAH